MRTSTNLIYMCKKASELNKLINSTQLRLKSKKVITEVIAIERQEKQLQHKTRGKENSSDN